MAKLEHLNKLFDAHTKDLNEILLHPEEIIACPICLRQFDRSAVDQKIVNNGHVWPKDIRKLSNIAGHMQVILCKSCNEKASQADKQMQLYEKLRRGEESGELYGVRKVRLVEEENPNPIELHVNVKVSSDHTFHITGRTDKDGRILDINPLDQDRVEAIFRDGKKAVLTVHPLENFETNKVPGAFITSAYLMAFYALGYRYITQDNVQVLRDYILNSFKSKGEELPLPAEQNFILEKYQSDYYPDPSIYFIFPYGAITKPHLLVSFLDAAVRLPFVYEPAILNWMIGFMRANYFEQFEKIRDERQPYMFRIPCTKTVVHDCLFDYLLKKPGSPTGNYGLIVNVL